MARTPRIAKPLAAGALAAVALAVTIGSAEARFRLRTGSFGAPSRAAMHAPVAPRRAVPVVVGSIAPSAAGAADRRLDDSGLPDSGIVTRSVLNGPAEAAGGETKPREAAKPAEKPVIVKLAEPWCPSGRIVGSGAGFCEIN